MNRTLIFVCSPYRGDVEANKENARRYCRHVYEYGDRISTPAIPFAPHLLFTQFLNDDDPTQRDAGLCLGLEMLSRCDELWAFGKPTMGMASEIQEAKRLGVPVRRFDMNCREVEPHE